MKTNKASLFAILGMIFTYHSFSQSVSTVANVGASHGLVVDKNGNLYASVYSEAVIKKITPTGNVSVFSGSGVKGDVDGNSTTAQFESISNMVMDSLGNIYAADYGANKIKKITPNGDVTTYAGTGSSGKLNNDRLTSTFTGPVAVEIDKLGNVYVADYYNYAIRKIDVNGKVTTIAGGNGQGDSEGNALTSKLNRPSSIAVHPNGNIYIADQYNNKIKILTPDGKLSTFVGSGVSGDTDAKGLNASFNFPTDLEFDDQNNLYITDQGSFKIRKVSPDSVVTTYAGTRSGNIDGLVNIAKFGNPFAIIIDQNFNVYFTDITNYEIKKISNSIVTNVFEASSVETNAVVYPIPAIDKIMVQASGVEKLNVFSPTGELVLEKMVKDLEEVNIQSLTQGLYFYTLGSKKGSFIVQ